MLDVKALLRKMLVAIKGETEVKEGCTIFRQGDLRVVRLDSPSAWCATLWAKDRPSATVEYSGVVYNGSTYVDCLVLVNTLGEVRVTTLYGATVPSAQYGYLRPRNLVYYV